MSEAPARQVDHSEAPPPRRRRSRWRRRLRVLLVLAALAGAVLAWSLWRARYDGGGNRALWRGVDGGYLNTTDYTGSDSHDNAR